eukprot:TRINITY_DN19912_c0_g1_i2.p1 TRINITY_DN19912_c0_g1~~TRINITY_DN19912_c0_g1_i2.p1  ORF type:complete len:114 (+),score=14.71 TRINITY_DN19912_c0_g1_i2:1-342(+)
MVGSTVGFSLVSSSAASDVYKRQVLNRPRSQCHLRPYGWCVELLGEDIPRKTDTRPDIILTNRAAEELSPAPMGTLLDIDTSISVSYTHLRAHETPEHLVCRLLLEKKKKETC